MAKKFTIVANALIVTDTVTGAILLDVPKSRYYFRTDFLDKDQIKIVSLNYIKNLFNGAIVYELSESIDSGDTPFTAASFRAFGRTNLGG